MIEKLIEELIQALNANTEALKASSQPTPQEPGTPPSMTTSQGSAIVTHDMTVITYGPAKQKAVQAVADAIEPPKRRGRPPKAKDAAPETVQPAVAPEPPVVVPEVVEQPKPSVTLEQVRSMGQKLLDLTGDPAPIREYVNARGCKALRELPPEQWADALAWLSQKVAELQS